MGQVRQTVLGVAGREVVITNPDKVIFPQASHTKLDLVKYYAAVAEAALRGIAARPLVLKRYVNGAEREPFFQKRAPEQRPAWVETVELRFPSGRTAREIVVRDAAQLLWRSEEHTSELQSLAYLVCRLLLEKKKNHLPLLATVTPTLISIG